MRSAVWSNPRGNVRNEFYDERNIEECRKPNRGLPVGLPRYWTVIHNWRGYFNFLYPSISCIANNKLKFIKLWKNYVLTIKLKWLLLFDDMDLHLHENFAEYYAYLFLFTIVEKHFENSLFFNNKLLKRSNYFELRCSYEIPSTNHKNKYPYTIYYLSSTTEP